MGGYFPRRKQRRLRQFLAACRRTRRPDRRLRADRQHEELQPPLQSGVYSSCNIPLSTVVRVQDIGGSGYKQHSAQRQPPSAIERLLAECKGRIDEKAAQAVISDHYDVYRARRTPSGQDIIAAISTWTMAAMAADMGRSIPGGRWTGKSCVSGACRTESVPRPWGRACGTPFDAGGNSSRRIHSIRGCGRLQKTAQRAHGPNFHMKCREPARGKRASSGAPHGSRHSDGRAACAAGRARRGGQRTQRFSPQPSLKHMKRIVP